MPLKLLGMNRVKSLATNKKIQAIAGHPSKESLIWSLSSCPELVYWMDEEDGTLVFDQPGQHGASHNFSVSYLLIDKPTGISVCVC